MKPQTAKNLPMTAKAGKTDDYLGITSYGGGSDHFTKFGAGIYGFNWWFNDTGRDHPSAITWPDAPRDTVMSIGAGGNNAAIIPSLGLMLVCAKADWADLNAGEPSSKINQALKLVAASAGYKSSGQAAPRAKLAKMATGHTFLSGPGIIRGRECESIHGLSLGSHVHAQRQERNCSGYFAADGNAAESSASAGKTWRVHFLPDLEGTWKYTVSFRHGSGIAVADDANSGQPVAFNGITGSINVGPTDKSAPGFYSKGLLKYTGERYWRFAETGEPFLKGGADSPENFFAYSDFDATTPTHKYEPHAQDARPNDPTWKGGKGKNILGALNYLASKRMNSSTSSL